VIENSSKVLKVGQGGDLTMTAVCRRRKTVPPPTTCAWLVGAMRGWLKRKKPEGVALRSSEAEEVIQVSVRAKTSMLPVSARSEIAVYLRGLRRERMFSVHILKVGEVSPGLSWMSPERSKPRWMTIEDDWMWWMTMWWRMTIVQHLGDWTELWQ